MFYAGLEKAEFTAANRSLSGRFTTINTHLAPDDPIYDEVVARMRIERDEALVAFGTKLLEAEPPAARYATQQTTAPPGAPIGYAASPFDLGNAFDNMAKIMVDLNPKLTGPEKENASEAADVSHFYKLLFASKRDVIQDDGTDTKIIVPANLHPLFTPVLTAD